MLCDNLSLPFRDESLDAVLSVAVIHHVATAERRVRALRELARVVRVGGRVMISVWAMEQRHRKVSLLSESAIMLLFKEPKNIFSLKSTGYKNPSIPNLSFLLSENLTFRLETKPTKLNIYVGHQNIISTWGQIH